MIFIANWQFVLQLLAETRDDTRSACRRHEQPRLISDDLSRGEPGAYRGPTMDRIIETDIGRLSASPLGDLRRAWQRHHPRMTLPD